MGVNRPDPLAGPVLILPTSIRNENRGFPDMDQNKYFKLVFETGTELLTISLHHP